jgi:hypothetical protein
MPRGRRSTRGPAAITPSCPLEVVNFIQTPGRPTGAHSRDRASAARRPGFPSNLRSRTHPGFRSTRTDAGRAKEGNAYAILRSSHSTCSGRAPLGLERFLGFPILRTLVIRLRDNPGAEHSGSGMMVLPVAASNAARSNASNATSDKCLAQAQSVYANFADIGIPLAKSPLI